MSDYNHSSVLETASTLPLVPYFSSAEHYDRNEAENFAKDHFICSEISLRAVASVLQENYKRRIEEAAGVSEQLKGLYFDEDSTFRLGVDEMQTYARFREVDSNRLATVGQRADVFFDKVHPGPLTAYEIYAGSREGQDDFADISFASQCLAALARERSVVWEVSPAMPKLSRRIPGDNDGQLHVVTTKVSVGSFVDATETGPESICLKSRHAGVLDSTGLTEGEKSVVDTLVNHRRDDGRTDALMAARRDLQEIIAGHPEFVTPVVESIYLTREGI